MTDQAVRPVAPREDELLRLIEASEQAMFSAGGDASVWCDVAFLVFAVLFFGALTLWL